MNAGLLRVKSYATPAAPALRALVAAKALTPLAVPDRPLLAVPPSFLGLSIDLNDIEGVSHPDFIALIKQLSGYGTGPMLFRVGAYSADRLTKPWPATVYRALGELHKATRARFIVGVNQHAEDPGITAEQVERSQKLLPPGSIESFAVGNEPDMYSLKPRDGMPGAAMPKAANWIGQRWIPVSRQVYKAAAVAAGAPRMLSGPDWSDTTMPPSTLQLFLDGVAPWLNMVTVHYYGGDVFRDTTIKQLLKDERMTKKIGRLKDLVKVARSNGNLPLRVTEVATMSYGGVQNISDTAGAAIWSLDAALEVAAAGASGINFHQVLARDANANYNAIYFDADDNRVRARVPINGYLMLQQALAGGADILSKAVVGECKVWALRGRRWGDLRIVVINKDAGTRDCAADIRLTADQLRKYAASAEARYMYASDGLTDRWRIYYSGSYFPEWGAARMEAEQTVPVQRYVTKDAAGRPAGGGFAVHLTENTIAALVNIPMAPGMPVPPGAVPQTGPVAGTVPKAAAGAAASVKAPAAAAKSTDVARRPATPKGL